MPETPDQPTIYTIGHGNTSVDQFIALLHDQFGIITVLVDVRSMPYSRYIPDFNREHLPHHLAKIGIKYSFAGDQLGGRPDDPTCYKNGEVPDGKIAKNRYLKLVDYDEVAKRDFYQSGLHRLLTLAQSQTVVIMCSEENPDHCHRSHLITKSLLISGIPVKHIRHDGQIIIPNLTIDSSTKTEPPASQLSLF